MPTTHVLPDSSDELQGIADCLWKAKKVLVVTGAGISTNSGIPDFRSKNGLYSLIQAQFEAAAAAESMQDEPKNEQNAPPVKRRRLCHNNERDGNQEDTKTRQDVDDVKTDDDGENETIYCASQTPSTDEDQKPLPGALSTTSLLPETPQKQDNGDDLPIIHDTIECGHNPAEFYGKESLHPPSSSPLSSPPPILFDPEDEFRSGSTTSRRSSSSGSSLAASCTSSDSDSESEGASFSSSQPTLSTQQSFASTSSGHSNLPVMKGRELFDASIWADPVKTSVFYTFATTLRQKIRDVAPTTSHHFISHLRDTGKLVRCYTQNIDGIEEKVGLTTSLVLGPGKKGRFSKRAAASRRSTGSSASECEPVPQQNSQIEAMVRGAVQNEQDGPDEHDANMPPTSLSPTNLPPATRDPCHRGVECVFLHGSLRQLRCFRCGHTTPWDEDNREHETLSGRQPSCPQCEGATAAREGRGKRALAVGKLRPDVVLYGEEHPNAHLIAPIVQHDLSLAPDMLLILGTSLKVHGLKVLVREFAKAVHIRGGKVVFVNFTKPPESVWSDIIDFWVQWDCDAWVQDLKEKKPVLWLPPGSDAVLREPKKKQKGVTASGKDGRPSKKGTERQIGGDERGRQDEQGSAADEKAMTQQGEKQDGGGKGDEKEKEKKEDKPPRTRKKRVPLPEKTADDQEKKPRGRAPNPNAKHPAAVRDDKANGAFVMWKIMQELATSSGRTPDLKPPPKRRTAARAKATKRPRHSAPAQLETAAQPAQEFVSSIAAVQNLETVTRPETPVAATNRTPHKEAYSILSAVKANPRRRRSKKVFEEGASAGGPILVEAQTTEPKRRGREPKKRSQSTSVLPPLEPTRPPDGPQEGSTSACRCPDERARDKHPSVGLGAFATNALHSSPNWSSSNTFLTHLSPPLRSPPASGHTLLPPIRQLFPDVPFARPQQSPFFFQDPLCDRYGFPPSWLQKWDCGDQLRREADEQILAAVSFGARRA
ncbi:hypothetical protein SPI_01667 [Niveomyces insectorum RCEF 264]|uniref:Deacetylase sirtuin-type domain-containing protein n=1 Tax=Niveomyces insectorum RCEF 264 TaxID=1081102 RepID=A0A167Z4V0_9HYPO|nr:hypothetical protein SPI_01667 [Niveomyces insectorum RCEF 264]